VELELELEPELEVAVTWASGWQCGGAAVRWAVGSVEGRAGQARLALAS
jgi:hypothetical protein